MRKINPSIVIIFTVASLLLATQYVAYQLAFDASLGAPLGKFIIPIYWPFNIFVWIIKYYYQAPVVFDRAFCTLGLGVFSGLIVAAISRNTKITIYGTARWATTKEINNMGFDNQAGVILGKLPQVGILAHNGPEHVLLTAPTRSGKGVGFVIPSLLAWLSSVVVLDLKKENYAATAGFRSKFSKIICFDPTSEHGACWNPLFEVRRGTNEVKDVQNIADILIDPNGSVKTRDHWMQAGHSLLVAAILHVLYAEPDKTLAGVANFLANPGKDIVATLEQMKTTRHLNNSPHPVIASLAQEMLNKSAEELSGVLSTAISCLSLYRDPLVANSTSKSDFKILDLMNAQCPVSLYIVIPASDLDRLTSLNRLMINLICRRLTECPIVNNKAPHKHKLLLLLDEFASLGCMEFFKKSLGFLAGYNIKCLLVCQSYNNIYEHYGTKNSIIDNCHIRIAMAPNDYDTAKMISNALGQTTVKYQQINFAGKRLAAFLTNVAVTDQESGRNLLNADEVQKLPKEQVIVMVANNQPILAHKIHYYQEEPFKSRCLSDQELNNNIILSKTHDWQPIPVEPSEPVKPTKKVETIKSVAPENIIFENEEIKLLLINKQIKPKYYGLGVAS